MQHKRRRPSTSEGSSHVAKRPRKEVIVIDSDDESLEDILAQITAQDESELLAKQLQDEQSAPRDTHSTLEDTLESDSDEALARRLALEWETMDNAASSASATQLMRSSSACASSKGDLNSSADTNTDPGEILKYRNVFIDPRLCGCGQPINSPRSFVVYNRQAHPPSILHLLHAPCRSCKTNHCRGCLSEVSCPVSCKGKDKMNEPCPVVSCCAEGRAIALFEALGGFDRLYLNERAASDQRSREKAEAAKTQKQRIGTVGPGGTGYSTDSGVLYSNGSAGRGKAGGHSASSDHPSTQWDNLVINALSTVTHFLPSSYSDSPQLYDLLPHASIESLLSTSQLPDLLGSLLRNDSVTDWTARNEVYLAVLALLRRLAECELTIKVLISERHVMKKSCGLEAWMWGEGEIELEIDPTEEHVTKAPPLYSHFIKLAKQSEAFLAGASHIFNDANNTDSEEVTNTMLKATSLCGDIIAAKEDIERAMSIFKKNNSQDPGIASVYDNKGKGRDLAAELAETYARECERLAFQHVSLSSPTSSEGLVYHGYNYAAQLKQTASATRLPKDRLHLIRELAVLATSLPPGVWVRVDEVRNDAIKVMIAGPEGTPYTNGLFEFDFFITMEYPNKPPLVHLRTTGGGRVRFNPNLYDNGKVCLSLLGTWRGSPEEEWTSKSTLLQVIISIQSMILVQYPYFNEPGFGKADANNPSSIAYNRNVVGQTIHWAIVDWLKVTSKESIWADVIASHFSLRKPQIRKQIEDWGKESGLLRQDPPMATALFPSQSGLGMAAPTALLSSSSQTSRAHAMLAEFDEGLKRVAGWSQTNK